MSKPEEVDKGLISFEKTKTDKTDDTGKAQGAVRDTGNVENIDKIRDLIFGGSDAGLRKKVFPAGRTHVQGNDRFKE